MAEQEQKKATDELTELKIKCGNYAQKCVDLMAEMQKKESDWKERESIMQRRMEEAMKLIKNLKTRVDQMEGEKTSGETTDNLQFKVKIAALEKQKKSYELDIKSLKVELEVKTVLESKKSRLVDLLDIKLQEKQKLVDLLQLKCNHQNAKVALADARVAQLERDKCEMALYLETMRQHMKKHGVEVGDPYEVRMAQQRELKKKLQDGIAAADKLTSDSKSESAEGESKSQTTEGESKSETNEGALKSQPTEGESKSLPTEGESKSLPTEGEEQNTPSNEDTADKPRKTENTSEEKEKNVSISKSTEVTENQNSPEGITVPSPEPQKAEEGATMQQQCQNEPASVTPDANCVQSSVNQTPVENKISNEQGNPSDAVQCNDTVQEAASLPTSPPSESCS